MKVWNEAACDLQPPFLVQDEFAFLMTLDDTNGW